MFLNLHFVVLSLTFLTYRLLIMKSYFLLIIFLLFFTPLFSTNYYFSPTGNNANTGLSDGQAWLSFDQLQTVTLQPGDSILLEAGVVFSTTIKLSLWKYDDGTVSGNVPVSDAENPIIITTYPVNGAAANIRFMADKNCIDLYNVQGVEIANLSITGPGMGTSPTKSVISIYNDDYFGTSSDTLKSYYIHDVTAGGLKNGISVGCWGKKIKDVKIENVSVHSNLSGGIFTWGENTGDVSDVIVRYCNVYNNAGDPDNDSTNTGSGIVIGNTYNALVEYCIAYNNGYQCSAPEGPVGIWTYASTNVTIQYCEAYENKTDGPADGGGFDIDGGCRNCTIQYCYSHDNEGAGYLICQYSGASTYNNNVVRYNISQNDGAKNGYGAINFWSSGSSGGIQNTQIYGNTIYNTVAPAVRFINTTGISGTVIRNNIFVIDNGQFLVQGNPSTAVAKFEGNVYWPGNNDFLVGNETSLEDWRTNAGQEMMGGSPVGYRLNPRLKNAGGGGIINNTDYLDTLSAYELSVTSPLLKKGLDLVSLGIDPGPHDYYNNAIPFKDNYDIGAHEYSDEWPQINLPDTVYIGWHTGDDTTCNINANVSWQILENISWVDTDIISGTGNDVLSFTVIENNPDTTARVAMFIAAASDSSVALPDTAFIKQIPAPTFNVVFTIVDGVDSLVNAQVGFSGKSLYTDVNGQVFFNHITIGNEKPFSVTKEGYNNVSGTIDVIGTDTNVVISMTPVSPGTFDVTFRIDDEYNALAGATVFFDSSMAFSDTAGSAVFYGVEPGNNLPYTIVAAGYDTLDSTVTVTDDDIIEYVSMQDTAATEKYTVTFLVLNEEDDSIQGATINLAGYGNLITDVTGEAVFDDVIPEDSIHYSITIDGYIDATGFVHVSSQDTMLTITIKGVAMVNETHQLNTILFPIPSKSVLKINSPEKISSVDIYSMEGKLLDVINVQGNNAVIPTRAFIPGAYLFIINYKHNKISKHKVIIE